MQYPRLYARQKPQGRMSGSKPEVIDCILVDYSAGGACLQLLKFVDLPGRFEVLYGTTRKHCRVVWRRGMRLGVAF